MIQSYLDSAEAIINKYLDVDTVVSSDVTERVKWNDCGKYVMRKRPITAVKTINGTTYTGTIGTDFIVENKRILNFRDIDQYLINLNFDSFEIVYTAGYASCPADIKLAEQLLVSTMYGTKGTTGAYESYQIGEEKVVFKSKEDSELFLKYLKPHKTFA